MASFGNQRSLNRGRSSLRQTSVLGLLAFVLATCSLLLVEARQDPDRLPGTPSLVDALGSPKPNAPLTTHPGRGLRVKIDRSGFEVTAPKSAVALRALDTGTRRWARYSGGVSRSTRFGHETIVVTPERAEHFLTVDERQGIKTWQWRLDTAGLAPRVGADGSVAFLAAHKLAGMHVEPVAILDEQGRDLTPKSLRWSVARDGAGWLLQLRLDDRSLPLPYVIDPAVNYRFAQVSDNGAAGGTSIVLNLPAGVAQNDLLFAHISARGGTNMSIATPTGWTLLQNVNNANVERLATFYRIATSSEPASYTFSFGGTAPSQQAVGAITAYYGVKANTAPGPLDVNGATSTGNNSTPSASSISAAASSLVIAAYSHGAGNGTTGSAMFTTATGMNERYDAQSQNATAANRASIAGDDILSAAAGATGAKSVTAGASARWVAHQVSFNVDNISPTSTTSFPSAGGSYNIAGWNAGCSPSGICGTASENDSSVQKVEVSIRQGSGNYWNGSSFSSTTEVWNLAGGTASWNYGFAAANFPAEGSYTVRVQVTDTAGNVSAPTSATFTADTTTPALPAPLASNPAGPANNNSPAISGAAEAGSTVKIYTTNDCSDAPAATGTAAAFASPGVTVSVSDDTSTTFKATATDAAGNTSGCSTSSVTYVEDSTAPALPTSLASNPAGPANDNSPAISGTAEAGSTVKLYTTGACTGAPTAIGTAAGFASPGLTVGVSDDTSTTFKATATDAAGNVSGCSSSSVTYVEDSTAPALPVALASNPLGPANDNSPAISGTVEAGSTVKLYTTGACTGAPTATGTAAGFASPGITVTVSDDTSTTFKATATDAAGNVSGCSSSSVTYVEDSTAPALPVALASNPVGPANDNSPKISGDAEAGSTIKLYTTSDCSGSVAANGTAAAFSSPGLTVAVADNSSTTFKATATDAAGNVSGCSSSSVTYVEDSTAPALPASLASSPVSPANDNNPKISGGAEAGSTVKLYTSNDCSGAVAASGAAATFSSPGLTVAVADNSSTTFKATATDSAGNVSGCSSSSVTYAEDSSAPAAPSSLGSTPLSPANDNSPSISGTSEAGSTVRLYTTSDCSGAVAASGTAASFASPGLTVTAADDSSTTFKATATDAAGNVSGCSSSSVTYAEDSTAPALPAALASTPVSPANDNSPAISGSAEAGSAVKLYTTSDCSGSIAASGTAAAFASPGLPVAVADDSSTTFKAQATDAAGNVGGCSASSVTYVEDSSVPTSTVTFPAAAGSYSPSTWNAGCASAGFCGSASDGSGSGLQKIELSIRRGSANYFDGSSFSSGSEVYLTASGTSSWSYGIADGQFPTDGDYTMHVRATDNAGNVESYSSRTFVFDSSAPSVPSLSFSSLTNASATGQTVFFRPGVGGGFRVTASASDPDSGISGYAFPALGSGWSGSQSGADYDYTFAAGAGDPAEPNDVTAQNNAGLTSSASFTVTPDSAAPTTSIACDGGPCSGGWYTSSVLVSLLADDGPGSGLQEIRYTTDGSDPSPLNGTTYTAPFSVAATTEVHFRAYDSVGNEEAVGLQLVRIDGSAPTAPALTLAEAPASAFQHVAGTTLFFNPQGGNSGSFTVDATTSDPESGIDRISFPALAGMTGGGDDSSSPYRGTYSWTASSSASGSQTVTAQNDAGLTSSSTFTVTPDTAPPNGGSVDYADGFVSGSVTITTDDGTDALSGVNPATGVIERDSTNLVGNTCDPFPSSWTPVTSPDSTITSGHCYRYRYRVSDNVGNNAVYTSGNVGKVSTSAPGTPELTLAEAPNSPNQYVYDTTVFYNPVGGNSGTFTVTADVTDSGGSGVERVSFPGLSGMTGGGDDSTAPYQGSYDWSSGSSAAGAQTVTVHNNAGLTSSTTFTVTPDVAPPTGQTAAVTGGYYTNLSVPVTLQNGSDALSSIDSASGLVERQSATLAGGSCGSWGGWASVSLAGGVDTSVQSNRCYRYRYSISDNVGNQSAPSAASADAKVDATAPVTGDDAPAGWRNAPVTVTLGATETGSGLASTQYRVDGGSFQSGTSIVVPAPGDHSKDGVHTIEYRSTDNAGNSETLRSATVRIDTTLPTTTDDAPGSWSTSAVTVMLSPADALSGIASTQYRVDGGSFQSGTSIVVPAPGDHSNDGVHTIEYRSTDNAGNGETLQTATVRIDTQLPGGALTAPADGAHVNGSVAISASASDAPSGVTSVEFLVRPNGSGSFNTISTDTTAPYDAGWDSTGEPEGNAELKVVVVDGAGQSFTSAIETVVVDNPPAPTLDDPGANLAGTVTLEAASQPDTAQVVFQRSPAGTGTWTPIATDPSAPFSADFDSSAVGDGNYDFRAVATDLGGFSGTSPLRTARVDNTAPSVSVSDPADGAIVSGPNVHVAAAASDLGSGVASVRFEQRPADSGSFTAIGTDVSAPYEASWNTTRLSGNYELRAIATDAAGNPGTAATTTVRVDATAPSVSLDDPGSLLRGVVNLTAVAPNPAIASVAFDRRPEGGSHWTRISLDTSRPWSAALDTKTIGDGLYELRAQALNSSGGVLATHMRESIRVDNTAPKLESATPGEGSILPSVTSIVLAASEPVAEVRGALLDGSEATAEISGSSVTFSTGPLGAGEHALTGAFVDAAGNTSAFALHFTIRVEAKATFVVQIGKPKTRSRGQQRLFLVSLNLSVPATVRATLLGPTSRQLRTIRASFRAGRHSLRFALPADSLPPGRYTIVVVANSADGTRITKRVTVTVPAEGKRAVREEHAHETVISIDETAPSAPLRVAESAPAPKPAPKSMSSSRKPKPKPQVLKPVRKPLETASTYARSKESRNIVLGLLLLTLGGGLAVLIKLEIGRLLSSTRRLGG